MEDQIMNIEGNEVNDVVANIDTEHSGKGLLYVAGVTLAVGAVIVLCKKVIAPAIKRRKAAKEAIGYDPIIDDDSVADADEIEVDA